MQIARICNILQQSRKQTSVYCSILRILGGITKHLMTGPTGNKEFCFPLTLASPWGALKVSGEQTHCLPWGQSLSAY